MSREKPKIVGIDSNILIYAGAVPVLKKSKTAPNFQDLSRRAKMLLHDLENHTIILPTVAITELLIPVPANKRGLLMAELEQDFVCPVFDQHSAAIAADIWAKYKNIPANFQYEDKQVMRRDVLIVASCRAANAIEFYTNDDNCRALADLVMVGRNLPRTSGKLFTDQELEIDEKEGPPKKKRPVKKKKK